ncbi:tetratricopeptide repeat-containing sensor histidine kinase [Marinifilum flexuosum]|uniref:tetratricopeptide repeat-containing sensor histidine kinase n=1 Tax=Marinifilum flexuosum TaxID=1117708 RepID=UPI0024951B8B|nr:tetratricopeptide repeat-containing sensor histidine kinase [Marinifilum flexuosum]
MLYKRLIVACVLFFSTILICFSQSDGKTVDQLFTEKSVVEEIQRLADECWRLRVSDSDSALVLGKRALELSIQYDIKEALPKVYGFIGVIELHYLYRTKESIPNLHNALRHSLIQRDSVQIAYSYNNLGDLYLITGNLPLSMRYSEYAVNMFEKLSHPSGRSYSYVNIGLVYREQEQFDLALQYFHKAIEIWRKLGNEVGIGAIYREIARTYEVKGDKDSAMKYYQRSYAMSVGVERVRYAAFCLNGMANIYYQRGQFDKAFEYYQNALDLNLKQDHDFGVVDNYIGMALVYAQKKKRVEGEKSLELAMKIALKLGINAKIIEASHSYIDFYKILGDYKYATLSFEKFNVQYDSVLSVQQFEIMNEMDRNFDMQNDLLLTEQKLKTNELMEQNLVMVIFFMIVVIAILIWRFRTNQRMNKKLEEMNQTKDKLFSVISHDLRNPFNSLIGFSELLITEIERKDCDKSRKYARFINQSAVEGLKLLTSLLHWSMSQSGKIHFQPEDVKFDEIINELKEFYTTDLNNNQIDFKIENEIDEVFIDPNIVRIVLMNLISNALKYTESNGTIFLSAFKNFSAIHIKVKDSGIGMSESLINKLFKEKSFTQSKAGLRGERGTGLGLSVVQELVQIHKGKIKVESHEGQGTTFELEFPCNHLVE